MKLNKIKRKGVTHFYIAESFRIGGKTSSRIIKKLGTDKEIKEKHNVEDAEAWAREQVKRANNLKSTESNKDFTKFVGIKYMYKLYHHFGIYDFIHGIEIKQGFKNDELNNLLFLAILDTIYFPDTYYLNVSYFFNGYFNEEDIDFKNTTPLFHGITENVEELLATLNSNTDIESKADYAFFANIELSTDLKLPDNKNAIPYIGMLFDACCTPITMLHSHFSDKLNKKNLNRGLEDFGFVDIYSNLDKLSIESMLPNKASLKKFQKLSFKEAKSLTNSDVLCNNTWNRLDYQQKTTLKEYTDIYHKTFPVKNNENYVVVAFYGTVYEIVDMQKKIDVTYSTLDNPKFNSKTRNKVSLYTSQYDFKDHDKGHRFYLVPKNMPFYLVASFDSAYTFLLKTMNSVPIDDKKVNDNNTKKECIIGNQIINYIANLFTAYTIKNSKYYINNMQELGFFLRSMDGAALTEKSSDVINQLIFRLNDLDIVKN